MTEEINKCIPYADRLNKKTVSKIRKRIMTRQLMEGRAIEELQITREEAEQLGEVRVMDNVKLIVVDKLGDMTNKDCFAYIDKNKSCYCLNNLECRNRECKFYRTDITIKEIEKSMRKYAIRK